jgi:hypothetical protein
MTRLDKPVRLSGHARDQLVFHGGTVQEVIAAIRAGSWQPAERGRLECHKNFAFNAMGNGRFYAVRQ